MARTGHQSTIPLEEFPQSMCSMTDLVFHEINKDILFVELMSCVLHVTVLKNSSSSIPS